MCQALCHSYPMTSTMPVLPDSLLMSTALKAIKGRNFIVTNADSAPQNNARALDTEASNYTVFKIHSSEFPICSVLHPTFNINFSGWQKAGDIP